MKKCLFCAMAAATALFFASCVTSPLVGGIYTDVTAPITATSNSNSSKVGTAEAKGILGVYAGGDASIEAAARNAGITKIHHVDYKAFSVLGVYSTYTVLVYGE